MNLKFNDRSDIFMAKKDKNLVKYGIKDIHIHPITAIDTTKTDGTAYTYDTAFKVPGTQSLNLTANWANNTVYADDIAYAEQTANLGYDGTWQNVKLTEEFEEKILGDVNGQENADKTITPFGMSFEFSGDKNGARVFIYHVDLTKRPDLVFNTKTNSLSVDSDTINLNAKPRLDTHDVKVKVYPGDALYDTILTTPPNPVERAQEETDPDPEP
jgi:phi13 family phage major tail protein